MTPACIPCPIPSPTTSIIEKNDEDLQHTSTESLCIALTNYFAEKNNIEALWMRSDNKKTYQITFYVEFGLVSDRILQDLVKLGIGKRNQTKIFVLPTAIILEGGNTEKNESVSTLSSLDDTTNNELITTNGENKINDITLTRKIRKRINESNFKKSVRARLMVHQVVASIRSSTELSFYFVLQLNCL